METTENEIESKKSGSLFTVLSIVLGVLSIIAGTGGAILCGIIGTGSGLFFGMMSVIVGIIAKRSGKTDNRSGIICGIVGLVLSAIFFAGYLAYMKKDYGKWGLMGGKKDTKASEIDKAWEDAGLSNINWRDLIKD